MGRTFGSLYYTTIYSYTRRITVSAIFEGRFCALYERRRRYDVSSDPFIAGDIYVYERAGFARITKIDGEVRIQGTAVCCMRAPRLRVVFVGIIRWGLEMLLCAFFREREGLFVNSLRPR